MVYGGYGICIESEVISLDSVQNWDFVCHHTELKPFQSFKLLKKTTFICLHISSLSGDPMNIFNKSVMYIKSFEKIQ